MQRGNRPPALLHNRSNGGPRRQGVINRRKRNSIPDAIRRCKKRFVLRQFLPVTSVKRDEQWDISGRRRKIIECFIGPLAPDQVFPAAKPPLRIPAALRVSVQVRTNRSHAATRRILPFALSQRPISPVRGVVCHVGTDSASRFRGKQYY